MTNDLTTSDLCRHDFLVDRLTSVVNEVLENGISVHGQRRRILEWPWKPEESNVIVSLVPVCGRYSGFVTLWMPRRTALACLARLRPDMQGSEELCEEFVCDLTTAISRRLGEGHSSEEFVVRPPRLATNLRRIPFPEGCKPTILQLVSAVGPFFLGAGFVRFGGDAFPSNSASTVPAKTAT